MQMLPGRSREAGEDSFPRLQSRAENDLEKLMALLKTFDQHKRTAGRSRDVIEWQSQIRSSTDALALQLRAMRELLESQQKSSTSTGGIGSGTCSSGSKQQLQDKKHSLNMLQQELQHVQDYQRSGFISGYQRLVHPTRSLESLPPAPLSGHAPAQRETVTAQQQRDLQAIRSTDADINRELGTLEEGTAALRGLARTQNEEVKLQSAMLEGMDTKFDASVSQAGTVNAELKSALKTKKSKRSCDVLATNVFCVVLALGLLVLLAVLLMNA